MKQVTLFLALFVTSVICNANNSNLIEEERTLAPFAGIEVSQKIDVTVVEGEEQKISIEADEDMMSSIITEVHGQTLKLSVDDRYKKLKFKESPVRVKITIPRLVSLTANTHSKISVLSTFATDDNLTIAITSGAEILFDKDFSVNKLSINVSSAKLTVRNMSKALKASLIAASNGEINLPLEVEEDIECSAASSGKIFIKGKSQSALLSATTQSEIRMKDFVTQSANAVATTSSMIQITVKEFLAATATYNGTINYWGKPKSVSKETTMGGRVK